MYEKFIEDTKRCLELSENELSNRKSGIAGESTVEQLENLIIPELNNLIVKINSGSIPPKSNRYLVSFAYAFKEWGWNMQNPTELYISLCRLNTSFENLE